ncbi:MAG: dephospho-CoA kinase, partial [Bdellovibrionales bacterium]|nr:dephospho-CoA kinase [Bdellovibrionales bacterium]
MVWIGLTGGISTGKSTVSELLTKAGFAVVSADKLAHDAIAPGTEGARRVREAFGETVFHADGSVDRAALGQIVFSDSTGTKRRELEGII